MTATASLPASITNLTKPTLYPTCTETAKLVRQALKEAFPEVKFSVRSSTYAGGASIRVGWMEGPLASQVEAIAKRFEGASFDGMTDMKNSRAHAINGQPVRFAADYVFCDRDVDAGKVRDLAEIFDRADRADWLTLACRFGISGSDALRSLDYHPDAREFASFMLRFLPQPQFAGRRSKTADLVTCLDEGE